MVTNRRNSHRPNRKSLQLSTLRWTPVLRTFDAIRDRKGDGMTILLIERNAYAAPAIADQAYVFETAGLV
jgi:ABC-type branched-subunit amino acid transport system ATPase component